MLLLYAMKMIIFNFKYNNKQQQQQILFWFLTTYIGIQYFILIFIVAAAQFNSVQFNETINQANMKNVWHTIL